MKKLLFVLIIFYSIFSAQNAYAKDASLSMVYTNALDNELPFSIFSKGSWTPDPKARFVKLHLYFDEPIIVNGLELDTCGSTLFYKPSIFFNFAQWVLRLAPKLTDYLPYARYPEIEDSTIVLRDFEKAIAVRSLTFNFGKNSGFKICGIKFKDLTGETYNIKTPQLVNGKVEASSILEPHTTYDPIYLFDSRFEYGWASNKQAKNVTLTFNFDQPKRVEKLRIWNGHQRSVIHCFSNSRVKKIKITGDGNYYAEVMVKDLLGSQIVQLPNPFEGKQLKFEVIDSFLGKSYSDLVISEIRFFDGKDWFMLDQTQHLKESIALNREQFSKSKVDPLLNDSFAARQENPYLESVLRFRADGSFYISGQGPPLPGLSRGVHYPVTFAYFSLGNYEIKESSPTKGLKLRLFGLFYPTTITEDSDCNGCGRDCNRNDTKGNGEQIFQEIVTIRPAKDGKFEFINESDGKKLGFKKMIFNREER